MLLKVRDAQKAVLGADSSRALLVAHARAAHAEAVKALGDAQLKRVVDEVVRRCVEYGVATTREQLRLMDLALVFGLDWQSAETSWLDAILSDRREPDATIRVRKAWRTALRRLASSL